MQPIWVLYEIYKHLCLHITAWLSQFCQQKVCWWPVKLTNDAPPSKISHSTHISRGAYVHRHALLWIADAGHACYDRNLFIPKPLITLAGHDTPRVDKCYNKMLIEGHLTSDSPWTKNDWRTSGIRLSCDIFEWHINALWCISMTWCGWTRSPLGINHTGDFKTSERQRGFYLRIWFTLPTVILMVIPKWS